jgi:prepilin-type processing-associated H-X9-DG protein
MDENLVGYLLNSLDPDTHRQVQVYLRANPEARRRLELLRQALEPLEADAGDETPPPGLCVRTLARIARQQTHRNWGVQASPANGPAPRPAVSLPSAPRPSPSQAAGATRGRWRRADLLVAAALLLGFLGLAAAALPRLWSESRVYACRNNLRVFHQALADYSEGHSHAFPKVEDQPPRNVAGVFVPILRDAGALPANVSLTCPGQGADAPAAQGLELGKLQYAYSLGYLATGALYGLTSDDDDRLPIMADGPAVRDGQVAPGNSLNHDGRGQNVLFIDGHVEFRTARGISADDDIYLNQDGLVAAGRSRFDTVLGASWATPLPPDQ